MLQKRMLQSGLGLLHCAQGCQQSFEGHVAFALLDLKRLALKWVNCAVEQASHKFSY
jgi:hypothetical protein